MTVRLFSIHAQSVNDRERLRLSRKTAPTDDTTFTRALRTARTGRTLYRLAIVLEVPLGTLRHWLTHPPRRSTQRVRLVTERLVALGYLS